MLGPTNPNRLYMWTGTIDPGGTGGGPVTDNSPAHDNVTLSWTTYPERLQQAGVSWQVYQEEDNYDDNALAWFKQFASAPAASPLWQRGMRKGTAGWFETDARAGRLPQVSWLVAPAAQSEHPAYFPAAGAEYIASKLDAIASNEDLWHKTLFILTYDENDGLFDHVPPPVAFLMALSIFSFGMFFSFALAMASRSFWLLSGLPPPSRAATKISPRQLGEQFSPQCILASFSMLNVFPFGMTSHLPHSSRQKSPFLRCRGATNPNPADSENRCRRSAPLSLRITGSLRLYWLATTRRCTRSINPGSNPWRIRPFPANSGGRP